MDKQIKCAVLTKWCVSKLPTDNTGINVGPCVITDCSPLVVVADLHSALVFSCATNKSHSTSCALNNLRSCLEKSLVSLWTYWQYYTPLVALQLYDLSIFNFTWAQNTNIIIVTTVVTGDTNPIVRTLQHICLFSNAVNIFKPDWPTSSSIESVFTWNRTFRSIMILVLTLVIGSNRAEILWFTHQVKGIPSAYTPLMHLCYPSCCHRLFPTCLQCRSPLFLHVHW